jgi:hypothetical protein
MLLASEFENPWTWQSPDMTNINFGFGLFFIILGIIVIIIGLISIKAEKIIAPMSGRMLLKIRTYRLKKGTLGFWAYIVMEILVGLICVVSGTYLMFFKN